MSFFSTETIYSVLNRQIVILLVYRGLPKEFLIGLVEEEIKGMLIDIKNYDIGRRRAYKLVRQNMRRVYSDRLIGESLLNHNEDNLDDEDRYSFLDLTTAPVEIRRKTEAVSASSSISVLPIISGPGTNRACCIAEELQTFLHTGQKLDEPRYVCFYISANLWIQFNIPKGHILYDDSFKLPNISVSPFTNNSTLY